MFPYLRTIFQELARNKARSALPILGIAVGIAAFMCVAAIGNAGSARIEQQLHDLGDNMIWIEAGSRTTNGIRVGSRGSRTLILEDAWAIRDEIPGIRSVSPSVDGRIQVVYGNLNWGTQYRGVSPEYI